MGSKDASQEDLYLLELILKQALHGGMEKSSLYYLLRMISLKLHAIRCSIIQCTDEFTGQVVASNDDENIQGLPLDLHQYPEIVEVRRTNRPLVVRDIRTSDLMAPVLNRLTKVPFETLAIFPLMRQGRFYGVLSLRLESDEKLDVRYLERFGGVCSQIISLAIGTNAPLS